MYYCASNTPKILTYILKVLKIKGLQNVSFVEDTNPIDDKINCLC